MIMNTISKPIYLIPYVCIITQMISCADNKSGIGTTRQHKSEIFERGEQLSPDLITGRAWHNKLFDEDSLYTTAIGVEEFEPGSRNVWHSHPSGQIIIILDGVGYHQIKGEAVEVLRKGDVTKCPPGVLHWHGASKDRSVTQIYILPNTEKGLAEWAERVTDEEYNDKVE